MLELIIFSYIATSTTEDYKAENVNIGLIVRILQGTERGHESIAFVELPLIFAPSLSSPPSLPTSLLPLFFLLNTFSLQMYLIDFDSNQMVPDPRL